MTESTAVESPDDSKKKLKPLHIYKAEVIISLFLKIYTQVYIHTLHTVTNMTIC
jgi:hypothetical protein